MKNKNESIESTPENKRLLAHCETTIEKGIKNFLAVGRALSTIREKRLYRLEDYDTFEEYCQTKWKISRQYASQLILTFRLNETLSTAVDKCVIDSPCLAKRFRKLDPDQQRELAEKVAAGSDLKTEMERAEQNRKPSELLRARKLSIQLSDLLQSASDKERMLDAIRELVLWITDYTDSKQKQANQEQKEAPFDLAA